MSREPVAIKDKYALNVEEAAAYFNIGPKKLRAIANDYITAGIVFQNGTKLLFKRERFAEFLDKLTII